MKGINDPQETVVEKDINNTDVKGINNTDVTDPLAALGSNNDDNPDPKPSTSTVNATPVTVEHTSNTSQASTSRSITANQNVTERHHKRKAKPCGKHYRPTHAISVAPKVSMEPTKL